MLVFTLLLATARGDPCLEVEDRMEVRMVEWQARMEQKRETVSREIEQKMEMMEQKMVVPKSELEQPVLLICAFVESWSKALATVSFDRLTTDHSNADQPGGADGVLDITSGTFTCLTAGHYTVTYSGQADLAPGQRTDLFLSLNGATAGAEGLWSSLA